MLLLYSMFGGRGSMYCFSLSLMVMVAHVVVVKEGVVACQAYTVFLGGRGHMYCFFSFLVVVVVQWEVLRGVVVEYQAYCEGEVEY